MRLDPVAIMPLIWWSMSAANELGEMVSIGSSPKLICQIGRSRYRYYRVVGHDLLSLKELSLAEAEKLYTTLSAVVPAAPVATTSSQAPGTDLSNAKKLVIRECGECPYLRRGGGFGRVAYIPSCGMVKQVLPYTTAVTRAIAIARLEPGIPSFCPLEDNR